MGPTTQISGPPYGESLPAAKAFYRYAAAGAADMLMPDVKYCGRLMELRKVTALAEAMGLTIAPRGEHRIVSGSSRRPNGSNELCAYGGTDALPEMRRADKIIEANVLLWEFLSTFRDSIKTGSHCDLVQSLRASGTRLNLERPDRIRSTASTGR